jgi:hypothetical protein
MPLLESMNQLIMFAQSRSAFVLDYVTAVKLWQAKIFMMYYDADASFFPTHFPLFNDIFTDHSYTISQEWITDLNNGSESLAFRIANHTYPAHQSGPHGEHLSMSRDDFLAAVNFVKGAVFLSCRAADLGALKTVSRFRDYGGAWGSLSPVLEKPRV